MNDRWVSTKPKVPELEHVGVQLMIAGELHERWRVRADMKNLAWGERRKVKGASTLLRQALMEIGESLESMDSEPSRAAHLVADAKDRIRRSRATIEEVDAFSFGQQSRFFRLFEKVEECTDYAREAIRYGEMGAAKTDVRRVRDGIDSALQLLREVSGISVRATPANRFVDRLSSKIRIARQPSKSAWEIDIRPLLATRDDASDRQAFLL